MDIKQLLLSLGAAKVHFLNEQKPIGTETTKNFNVTKYRKPASKDIVKRDGKPMYRTIVTRKKSTGEKRLITVAIKNKPGPEGGRTQMVNIKREK